MRDNTQWEMANESYLFLFIFFEDRQKYSNVSSHTNVYLCVWGGEHFVFLMEKQVNRNHQPHTYNTTIAITLITENLVYSQSSSLYHTTHQSIPPDQIHFALNI